MLLRNTLGHRIYFDDGARFARAGALFEGDESDAKRPGVEKVSKSEQEAIEAAEAAGADAFDRAARASDLAKRAAALSTGALRDPFAPDGSGHTVKGPGDHVAVTDAVGEPYDAATGGPVTTETSPTAILGTPVSTQAPAGEPVPAESGDGTESAADLEAQNDKDGLIAIAKAENVDLASKDTKAKIAAKIVAARAAGADTVDESASE
jgi:hypothetical protein